MFRVPPDMVFMQTAGAQGVNTLRARGYGWRCVVGHFGFGIPAEHLQDALPEARALGAEVLKDELAPAEPQAYPKDLEVTL